MNDGAGVNALPPAADAALSMPGESAARAVCWPTQWRGSFSRPALDSPNSIRVVLIEDHDEVRNELRHLLSLNDGVRVVGESATGREGIELALRLQPDVVLTDLTLPDRSGLQVVGDLRRFAPAVKVVVLTAHYNEDYVRGALDAGTHGYVVKDAGREDLMLALLTVLAGQRYLCASIAARVIATYLGRGSSAPSASLGKLTRRERQVMRLIAIGKPNKHIAYELGLSVKTVEKHRGNFMRKLGIHGSVAIAHFAFQNGIISLQDLAGEGLAA